ncbi:iron-containing alcohol dehydrogenase [Pseudoduganella sp. FT55W]|uniref:Iron-containing alcohol dehydrogenase n=1 Tax=Duganella rivi TaxID=2666083 RepID=A0A7X4K985_9BURK|nr:iron-containing alcohol dehydrogenase [Duganella rivi]MYM65736.1 iron-containing alcohol dehydrogenase [Duganella rivi]
MLNFDLHNPTRIVFGAKTVSRLDELVPAGARVLILYGGESARRNGTLAEVRAGLGQREVHEFGGIEPNPSYETLMEAVALIQRKGLNFLLAVGGGSVIDGTKFVAAAVDYPGDPWEIMESHGATVHRALPFGTVLTLPATGSEMNKGSVVSKKATKAKLVFASEHVFPRFSILDPTKTYSLPLPQVANGVVDAFTHVMEQYLTYPVDGRVQDRFAEGLLQTLVEIGAEVMAKPDNYDARANLMWTATLALNGLIVAGVPEDWSTHMIGHELTALHGIDHARTLAAVLPANLQVRREAKRAKLLQYAERIWNITEGSEDERIGIAITSTRVFFESLGVPTRLREYGLNAGHIDEVIAQLEAHGMTALGEHEDVTLAVSRQILEAAL